MVWGMRLGLCDCDESREIARTRAEVHSPLTDVLLMAVTSWSWRLVAYECDATVLEFGMGCRIDQSSRATWIPGKPQPKILPSMWYLGVEKVVRHFSYRHRHGA